MFDKIQMILMMKKSISNKTLIYKNKNKQYKSCNLNIVKHKL